MAPVSVLKPTPCATRLERRAVLAHLQGMVEETKLGGSAEDMLRRIDELLAEVTWLQAKYRAAAPLFADRINARMAAIAVELRALNQVTNGHTVTCWFEAAELAVQS